MAQRKRRKPPVQPQTRTWTIPRFLLLIGYGLVFAFLGTLFLMRQELMRVGIFGDKSTTPVPTPQPQRPAVVPPQVTNETQRSLPPSPPQVITEAQSPTSTARPSAGSPSSRRQGEITDDEKQALDAIIRSKR